MKFLSLELPVQHLPPLDPEFLPLGVFFDAHARIAAQPFAIALARPGGQISLYETKVCGTAEFAEADAYYLERLLKFLLWSRGGYRVYLCGNHTLAAQVQQAYLSGGAREFDRAFMSRVYERPFEVILCSYEARPQGSETAQSIGGHLSGCRIGFDAGGSDRKVSAVIDGESVFSEEVVWFPKVNSDPEYHFEGIVSAMKTAAEHLPRVDAIGISSAGVFVDNRCMVASLFLQVPEDKFDAQVKDIYLRAAAKIGADIPVSVCNDGDVTALAGAMGLKENAVLGLAMGTSEAVGYVDANGCITGYLNELAFAPVDAQPDAPCDEWSGDIGCGVKYFSQDGIIRLAGLAGIELSGASLAEQLKEVQTLMAQGDARAEQVYRSLGIQLGHTLALYTKFYEIKHILTLGRVMSGTGGDIILEEANRVLSEEYPTLTIRANAPDEMTRRVGQSVAAASLPEVLA